MGKEPVFKQRRFFYRALLKSAGPGIGHRIQITKEKTGGFSVCSMEPPSARVGASLSGSEDGRRVWLFGGNAGGASLNDLYCLELETRTWSQVLITCWNELKSSPHAAQSLPLPFILPHHHGLFVLVSLLFDGCCLLKLRGLRQQNGLHNLSRQLASISQGS